MVHLSLRAIPFQFESFRMRLIDSKFSGRVFVYSQDSFIKTVVSRIEVPPMLRVVKSQQLTFPIRFFLAEFSVAVSAHADRLGVFVQERHDWIFGVSGYPPEHRVYDPMAAVGVISMWKKHKVRVT